MEHEHEHALGLLSSSTHHTFLVVVAPHRHFLEKMKTNPFQMSKVYDPETNG